MGNFNVEVKAVGGHGCQRDVKDDETVKSSCGTPGCPDCAAREFVEKLRVSGCTINSAVLTHWPGTADQVVDNLLTLKRRGNF